MVPVGRPEESDLGKQLASVERSLARDSRVLDFRIVRRAPCITLLLSPTPCLCRSNR